MAKDRELLQNGTAVWTAAFCRVQTDALLLAAFSQPKRLEAAWDLGTGCGIIPLAWHDAGYRGQCIAVDSAPGALALLAQSIDENALDHITPRLADIADLERSGTADVVAANPPYFSAASGPQSPDGLRAAARHEGGANLFSFAATAAVLLKNGGRFCLCQRPQRLAEVFFALQRAGLEPKRLQFVRQRRESPLPWLALVEGRKQARPGLSLLPDLLIEDRPQTGAEERVKP